MVMWKRPKRVLYRSQGVCSSSSCSVHQHILVAKSLVTVSRDNKVPVKILNPTSVPITIFPGNTSPHSSIRRWTTKLQMSKTSNLPQYDENDSRGSFLAKFIIPEHLSEEEQTILKSLLHRHEGLFVTKDNPELGFTDIVQHKILLKPDVNPKHQRPYIMPPDKR